jgi:hypothetical protein
MSGLHQHNFGGFAVETAGTISPGDLQAMPIWWTVSPKLANSGNPKERRYIPHVLEAYNDKGADFKFVIRIASDLNEVEDIVAAIEIPPQRVWIMPEGTTKGDVMWNARHFKEEVLARGWNLTLRQQILLFDEQRGV